MRTPDNRAARRLPQLPRRHKYKVLLALLLVSLVIQTYGLHAGFAGVLSDIFRTVLFMTVYFVVFRGARERVPGALLLLATVIIGWARHFSGGSDDGALALAFNALLSLFLWTAVAVILRDLFRTPEAGAGNVLGAICGYHYSFAQMTMLGYADITPVRAPATTLSLFATLFGMFYTAIVVSQFVGLAQASARDVA